MRIAGCVVLALLVTTPAHASPFTWLVQGTITRVTAGSGPFPPTPYDGLFAVGQPFEWSITMDSDAPDLDPNPACGLYFPITAMRFSSGAVSLSTTQRPGQDYLLNASGGGSCIPPDNGSARIRADFGTGLFLSMHFSGAFVTDALPTDPQLYGTGLLDLLYPGLPPFGSPVANANVTSIAAIPEPMQVLLLAGGLLAGWRARWQRRQR